MTKLNQYSTAELFAGAGGLAIGMVKAGFDQSVLIEWEHNAARTLMHNVESGLPYCGSWNTVEGDVRTYDFYKHRGQVNFVAGGPPCQPFSLGGKHKGHGDSRNMFPEAIRAVREIRPIAFVFENVKGLLRRDFFRYYSYIIRSLSFPNLSPKDNESWDDHLVRLKRASAKDGAEEIQYNVVFQLLNAADFGVPQLRERVFIVGIRSDQEVEYAFPEPTHCEDSLLYDKWISGEYWARHKIPKKRRPQMPPGLEKMVEPLRHAMRELMPKPWTTVRDAIADLPKIRLGKKKAVIANHVFNPGARSYAGHTGSDWDWPSKTLKAGNHGVPGGENTLRDGRSVRYFTVRECARLQTFPDEWVFMGSWTETMRQLGNAVPVDLAASVGKKLIGYFQK